MTRPPYVDTSALAKWYLNEPRSEDFVAYVTTHAKVAISRLTTVEFASLLARRRRAREIALRHETHVLAAFDSDVNRGFIEVHPLEDRHAVEARALLVRLRAHPLRTLDALHLAIARSVATSLATADAAMAAAASALKLDVVRFD